MLKRQKVKGSNQVKVTFVTKHDPEKPKVSVVGDFNEWNPAAHQMVKRANNTRSVTITLPANSRYAFRYYAADGTWFDEEAADDFEPNEFGTRNCVILT